MGNCYASDTEYADFSLGSCSFEVKHGLHDLSSYSIVFAYQSPFSSGLATAPATAKNIPYLKTYNLIPSLLRAYEVLLRASPSLNQDARNGGQRDGDLSTRLG